MYLSIAGINDYFFDVVFGIEINKDTYDFKNKKYFDNLEKNIFYFVYIIFNIFILVCCCFSLIFIEIPIIRTKKKQKKRGRFTRFKEQIEKNEEQFDINERFTAEPVV